MAGRSLFLQCWKRESPCRSVIKKGESFGCLLYDFLATVIPLERIHRLLEIGGGYGHLMRDFLARNGRISATMIDISPFLLAEQQKTIQGLDVTFIQQDFLEMDDSYLSKIPYIYASDHSCEAQVPEELSRLIDIQSAGDPERISLRGHDEYTVRFSDLEKVAASFGYTSLRGQYLDFIEPLIDGDLPFILCLDSSKVERYEIIRQFVEDLIKYEYLVLRLNASDSKTKFI